MLKFFLSVALLFTAGLCSGQLLFTEEYRPQFHFTPQSGWIGDPDGMIKFENKYHLFWWGHAESTDLVLWEEKIHPMRGGDGSFQYYTGSVVVDKNNTSGFGNGIKPPMVAVYTAHNNATGIQDQRISYSTDYELFNYYENNPVLTINSKEFRDPDVFWHEGTNRWIMCITLPIERKINLYASNDLKSWEYMSSFGPVGAQDQVWEVPQLISIPIQNNPPLRKWVMICSMGPNKMQYFVGDFDGTTFTLDQTQDSFLKEGTGVAGEIFESFESGYDGWVIEGTAFGSAPASGTLPDQNSVNGYFGTKVVNSYQNGDASTGKLTSPLFTIEENNINFLIGGGNHPSTTGIQLLVDGKIVRTATGHNSESLKWKGWNVSEFKGKQGQLIIVDSNTGSWGHINVDHIMFSDISMNTDRENAYWFDYGADFYAGRCFRDFDDNKSVPVWLGWMSNWEYANATPTSWGRGAESIPRTLQLKPTDHGLRIIQQPIEELKKLRGEVTEISNREIDGIHSLNEFLVTRNTYEFEATFYLNGGEQYFGFNLCKGPTGKLILGYDSKTSQVILDRRLSGNTSFSPQFPKIMTAPVSSNTASIKFHVFVDQSSIEVFVNDGEVVLTSLIFPSRENTAIEIFAENNVAHLSQLRAWRLSSIWGIEPTSPVTGTETREESRMHMFPNPVKQSDTITMSFADKLSDGEKVSVQLLDSKGMLILKSQHVLDQNRISLSVDVPPGLYLITVHSRNYEWQEKLLVH